MFAFPKTFPHSTPPLNPEPKITVAKLDSVLGIAVMLAVVARAFVAVVVNLNADSDETTIEPVPRTKPCTVSDIPLPSVSGA
ncbi:MAG: hypothetical protein MUF71_21290 [Candidatus Kapabacteria bacterium]|nr:hypothetical protein [Candidatus Kapabacteria bacterium]